MRVEVQVGVGGELTRSAGHGGIPDQRRHEPKPKPWRRTLPELLPSTTGGAGP